MACEQGGLSAALSPGYVFRIATKKIGNTLLAWLMELVANFIGGLGVYACCVGVIFTAPYGSLLYAGILRHYEYSLEPPAAPPAAAPAPA